MKRLITMVIMVLAVAVAMAQAPEKFTYQAVVRNASNALVANTLVGVRVSILQGGASGSAVYMETQAATTNANGLVTLSIGGGNVQQGTFGNIDWSAGPYFLKTEIDPNGGNNYSVTSTQQLLSVPYALYSKEAGNSFSGDYNDLTNTPDIPTVPTNVSAFTNDAGYLTIYTETDPQFNAWDKDYNDLTNKPVLFDGDYNSLSNKPVLFDGDYNSLTNQPTIPTVPTNVSAFTNDVGYLTEYTEQQVLSISNDTLFLTGGSFVKLPAGFDGDYNSLTNKPTIPTVPTNVSAFTNDAGYLTEYTEQQVLSISNDTLFLTGGSYVKLPAGFDGDYNSLTNKPTIPTVPTNVSAFNNDAGYITSEDIPEIPTVPTNVSAFTNDAGYLTSYTESQTLADVTSQGNSAGNRQLKDVSDPTESYDAVNLRTLASHINSLQDTFQQQMQQMQQQMSQMQQKIDSLQNIVNSLDTNDNTPSGTVVIDEKSCPAAPTVTDHEGNVYATVQIGNQCWMRDNLRTTTSPSTGTYLIPAAGTDYTYTGKQAFWYDNDSATYAPMNYGLLYNWNAAMDTFNTAYGEISVNTDNSNAVSVSFTGHCRGICPAGWHLPSDAEWTQLENYVGSQSEYTCGGDSSNIAKALASTEGWNISTYNCAVGNALSGNNATGFSAVPAGHCYGSSFYYAGFIALFWSSPQNLSSNAYSRSLANSLAGVFRDVSTKGYGRSVRCLRDSDGGDGSSATLPTVITNTVSNITPTTATSGGNIIADGGASVTARGVCWSTSQNPTVNGSHTADGSGMGSFSSSISGLTANTTYYVRAYATNSVGTAYGEEVTFTTLSAGGTAVIDSKSCPGTPTVTDHEGNVYATVQIGNQCWMRDNLRTTTSPSTGTYLIPAAGTDYTYTGKQAFWYDNDSATYAPMNYGLLYNWNAAMDTFNTAYGETSVNLSPVSVNGDRRGICPVGWHLPSQEEWTQLETYVYSQSEYSCSYLGDVAKALASETGWYNSTDYCSAGNDPSSNNATGFSAVPAGSGTNSSFNDAGTDAWFWSSSQRDPSLTLVIARRLSYNSKNLLKQYTAKYNGYSVRCLRDESGNADTTVIPTDTTATPDDTTTVTAGVPCPGTPTVTDHEGNVYATVQIGNQCWMRDNLRTATSPSTGTYLIPAAGTGETYTGKQAFWYDNDSATYAPMNYGLLYNWNAAVDTFNTAYGETSVNSTYGNAVSVTFSGHRRGICPVGWHLPSDAEWDALMLDYVRGQSEYLCNSNINYFAKALAADAGWYSYSETCCVGNDQSVNNATGFSAVPAGLCLDSWFDLAGYCAYFWSSSQIEGYPGLAWDRGLYYDNARAGQGDSNKDYGYSVRCLRDY